MEARVLLHLLGGVHQRSEDVTELLVEVRLLLLVVGDHSDGLFTLGGGRILPQLELATEESGGLLHVRPVVLEVAAHVVTQ